jgi:hypothetical protein
VLPTDLTRAMFGVVIASRLMAVSDVFYGDVSSVCSSEFVGIVLLLESSEVIKCK